MHSNVIEGANPLTVWRMQIGPEERDEWRAVATFDTGPARTANPTLRGYGLDAVQRLSH